MKPLSSSLRTKLASTIEVTSAAPKAVEALNLAAHPQPDTMKIAIQPGTKWEG